MSPGDRRAVVAFLFLCCCFFVFVGSAGGLSLSWLGVIRRWGSPPSAG